MSEHESERERRIQSPYGRRELDNYRFNALEKRMESFEEDLHSVRENQINDRLAMRELVASLPHVYVPRTEHERTAQWAGQRLVIGAAIITPMLSVIGLVVAIINQ